MAASNATLNPEPSNPEERKGDHRRSKTYAEVVEQNVGNTGNTGNTPESAPSQYAGAGKDAASQMPVKETHRKPSSLYLNGTQEKPNGAATPFLERFGDKNGERLTSVNDIEFEESLKTAKKQQIRKRRGDELVSGRQAGRGWDRSSIRFAPLNVPVKRRLQTLVVLWHTLCIALFVMTFFFLCAIPILWPLLLPYIVYLLFSTAGTSGTLTRRSQLIRGLKIWSLFASYFPARLHRSQVLAPTRKYVFGYHPHGIISHGAFAAFATEALGFSQLFPGITNTLLTLDSNFRIPLYCDYLLAMGLRSVSRESCENLLSNGGANGEGMGRAITIVVGGARESLDAQPSTLRLVLKRRKGFVKLAIRQGADLVPVLSFGENELYEQLQPKTHPGIHRAQLVLKKLLGFTIPLFHARGVFNYDVGLMPYRRPLNIVVGRAIRVVQDRMPSEKYVDEIHGLYVAELERIWREWRGEFAGPDTELEIVG